LEYFIFCVGLTASTLPSSFQLPKTEDDDNSELEGNRQNQHSVFDMKVSFCCLVTFLPSLLVIILKHWTRPDDVEYNEYLRGWSLFGIALPIFLMIVAILKGLYLIKDFTTVQENNACRKWIFQKSTIFIFAFMGAVSCVIFETSSDEKHSLFIAYIMVRISGIFQLYIQTIFLLILERTSVKSYKKIWRVTLYLSTGNLLLWIYYGYLKGSGLYTPYVDQVIIPLLTMYRFLSFVEFYRIYYLGKSGTILFQ
jgi:hypothetical protein